MNGLDRVDPCQRIDIHVPVVEVRLVAVLGVENHLVVEVQPFVHLEVSFYQQIVALERFIVHPQVAVFAEAAQ